MTEKTACIVVAAGSGTRFGVGANGGTGGDPKQFRLLGGRPMYRWAAEQARQSVDFVVLVVAPTYRNLVDESVVDQVVGGGATRSESVSKGLAVVPEECGVILVHDAARPMADASLFVAVIDAVRAGADAAIPGVPVVDTIKRIERTPTGKRVIETVDREQLVAVQTPQAFRAERLRQAHRLGVDATDDAKLIEELGGRVIVVEGSEKNRKVTTPQDFLYVESLIEAVEKREET